MSRLLTGSILLAVATAAWAVPARAQEGARNGIRRATRIGAQGAVPSAGQPPLSAFDSAKARALLERRLPCLGCHTLGRVGGHVGPDLATVRERRTPQYIAAMIDDPQRVLPGSAMPKTPMSPSTRTLIVAYLGGSVGVPAETARATTLTSPSATPSATDGAALYARWCASCHGTTGAGDGPNAQFLPVRPAAHREAAITGAKSDDQLFDAIAAGGAAMGRSARMPVFGETLSPAQIRTVVAHLRKLCRCTQPAWADSR